MNLQQLLWVTFAVYLSLLGLFLYWNVTRSSGFSVAVWLVQSLPLLALLPGMLTRHHRAFTWLCFVMLPYFVFAVEQVFISTATYLSYLFLTQTVILFIASMLTSKQLRVNSHTISTESDDTPLG